MWSKFQKSSIKSVLLLLTKDLYYATKFFFYYFRIQSTDSLKRFTITKFVSTQATNNKILRNDTSRSIVTSGFLDWSFFIHISYTCIVQTPLVIFNVCSTTTNCKPNISFPHFVDCEIFSVTSVFSRLQISIHMTWKIVVPVLQAYIYALIILL